MTRRRAVQAAPKIRLAGLIYLGYAIARVIELIDDAHTIKEE